MGQKDELSWSEALLVLLVLLVQLVRCHRVIKFLLLHSTLVQLLVTLQITYCSKVSEHLIRLVDHRYTEHVQNLIKYQLL